tara:strand:+ start:2682 stop:3731 length:1050 start_codon:yes stop_codon:yes gene_type:complete
MINFYFVCLILFTILLFLVSRKLRLFSDALSIYDIPDKKRKLHKKKTPVIGWIYPLLSLIFLLIISFFDYENIIFNEKIFINYDQINIRSYLSLFVGSFLIFLIGLYDDKKNISATNKIIFLIFTLYILISFDNSLTIKTLYLEIFDKNILLENFSLPFSILCIIFLINSLNLYDGINLQSAIFLIFLYSALIIKGVYSEILIFFLISNIFFALKNYDGKIFYGDSGIYLNAYIISYFIINDHNYSNILTPELILIFFYLPAIDLIRLFIVRVLKLKNPFDGDRNHIHHILLNFFKGSIFKVNATLIIILVLPLIMYDFAKLNFYLSLFLPTCIYVLFVINFYRYKKYQ